MRLLIVVALTLTLAIGFLLGLPHFPTCLEVDLDATPTQGSENVSAEVWRRRLEEERGPLLLRRRIQDRVVRELIQGQRTLERATAVFRHVNEKPPFKPLSLVCLRGNTPEEKYARHVLDLARDALGIPPPLYQPGMFRHLEAELEGLLAQPGGWKVPEADPAEIPELGYRISAGPSFLSEAAR